MVAGLQGILPLGAFRPTLTMELFGSGVGRIGSGALVVRPTPPPIIRLNTTSVQSAAARRRPGRIAIQISGHLRLACAGELHMANLLAVVAECRAVATCDILSGTRC